MINGISTVIINVTINFKVFFRKIEVVDVRK